MKEFKGNYFCVRCSGEFPRTGPKNKVCDDCRKHHTNEKVRERDRKKRAEKGSISKGSLLNCEICNEQYVSSNGLTKYCGKECSKIAEREKLKERERKNKGTVFVGDEMPCKDCGKIIIKNYSGHVCCEDCRAENQRRSSIESYHNNRDKRLEGLKTSREKRKQKYADNPELYEAHLEKERIRSKKRRQDPKQNLDFRMCKMIYQGLKGKKQGRSWLSMVDYTLDDLVKHLESRFLPGMSWEKMNEFHIDHILPRKIFNYSSPEDEDFKKCWSLDNLQPLWVEWNLKKGAKLDFVLPL